MILPSMAALGALGGVAVLAGGGCRLFDAAGDNTPPSAGDKAERRFRGAPPPLPLDLRTIPVRLHGRQASGESVSDDRSGTPPVSGVPPSARGGRYASKNESPGISADNPSLSNSEPTRGSRALFKGATSYG